MQLTKREAETLLSVASIIIPVGGNIKFSYTDISIVEFVNNYLIGSPKHIQRLIRFNLWFIEYCSWIFNYRPSFFSTANQHVRKTIITKLQNSNLFFIRGIYLFTSLLILIPFYNDNRVLENIGYLP
jgi:hypothetical protein